MSNNNNFNSEPVHSLKYFLHKPAYKQCYAGLNSVLGTLAIVDGHEYTPEDYATIFQEAECYVKEVLQSDFPEISIANIQARIRTKYKNQSVPSNGIHCTIITSDWRIGCLIEMVFTIVLWDRIEEKSELVMEAFKNSRAYFEFHDIPNPYKDNPMWKLIVDRIPYFQRKYSADYEKEIEQLKDVIEEKDSQIEKQTSQLEEKNKELEMAHAGWDKIEEDFSTKPATKRVSVLKYLLDMPNQLTGNERKEFKDICRLVTKCPDTTLERLLSNNSLVEMEYNVPELLRKYPILLRKTSVRNISEGPR